MLSLLANYAWFELVSPVTLVVVGLLIFWYNRTMVKSPQFHATSTQKTYFTLAISLFFLVKGTPFAVIADHYLASALLLQLSIMAFAVVPLFILSLPREYLKVFLWHHRRAKVAKFIFAHPWPLAVVFNGLITFFIVPPVFNAITANEWLLFLYEVVLITFAFLVWWIIIQPAAEISEHSYFTRGAYVFLMALFLMPVAIFLIVAQNPLYTNYIAVSGELLPALTAHSDQQLAGGFLKLLQLSSFSIAIYFLLKRWRIEEVENEGKVDDDTVVVQGILIKLSDYNRRTKGRKR